MWPTRIQPQEQKPWIDLQQVISLSVKIILLYMTTKKFTQCDSVNVKSYSNQDQTVVKRQREEEH
jgi:hypothetical protein